MQVKLKLYGNLRRYADGRREVSAVELPEGHTVSELLAQLGIPERDWWMIAVDDTMVDPSHVLHDRAEVEIFEPVGGGDESIPASRV